MVAFVGLVGEDVAAQDEADGRCCRGGDLNGSPEAGASGASGGVGSVTSWVVGVPDGGVRRPSGARTCTSYRPATSITPDGQSTDVEFFMVDPDGVTAILFFRDCDGVRQFVWVRQESPVTLASMALSDVRSRLLVAPEVVTSPPGRAIVNLESWLSVVDPGQVSASAGIPGLSSTVTATVASTTWVFGDAALEGDPARGVSVVCDGVGVAWTVADGERPAPCGHTFSDPAGREPPHVASVTVEWEVSWQASNGQSGTLDPVVSDAHVFEFPIDEIQTIGQRG